MAKTKGLCRGCREDFYNDHNPQGVKECWNYATARVVKRWRIGWWVPPKAKSDFSHVTTLSCHRAPGQYADFAELPAHVLLSPRKDAVNA